MTEHVLRTCITCSVTKSEVSFGLHRKGGTRRRTECITCASDRARERRAAIKDGTHVPRKHGQRTLTGELRTCTRCEKELDTSMFDRDSRQKSGLHSHCKTCRAAHNHLYLTGGGHEQHPHT